MGGSREIEPGDEVGSRVNVGEVTGLFFNPGDGVEENWVEIVALDKLVKVSFLVVIVSIEEVFVDLFNGYADTVGSSVNAELPKVGEGGFVSGQAMGVEGKGLPDRGAVGTPTVNIDFINRRHLLVDVE